MAKKSAVTKPPAKSNAVPLIAIVLALITVMAYLPVLRADYVSYDDELYVTTNPHVQSGITPENLKWAFNVGYQSNWHPLTWISHMADVTLFGAEPAVPHAVNLLLHVLNTIMLFFVLNRMTKSPWKSGFVAALFAVHPMHVESVAWVAERKDVLSALFWMLTMWAYVRFTESPSIKRYSVIILFLALGLMSKPTLVSLPLTLILLDYWPLGRWNLGWWKLIREKSPLFFLSAGSCVITYIAQQTGGAVTSVGSVPLFERIINALVSYVGYIAKMFWPVKLAVIYPYPTVIPVWQWAGAALLLVTATILITRSAKRHPYLLAGWLWYLIVLVPMIGLVQVGSQAMADRYTYISFIGLFIMLSWGAAESMGVWECGSVGVREFGRNTKKSTTDSSPGLWVFPAVVLLALTCLTWRQAGFWRDSITLWTHTLAVTKDNSIAHCNLGKTLFRQGKLDEAAKECEKATKINPEYFEAYSNLGSALDGMGRYTEAVDAFNQAIRINPKYQMAYRNLGVSYFNLGRYTEAVDAFNQAINLDPSDAEAYNSLGCAYISLRRYPEAVDSLNQAIHLNPNYAEARANLGSAYITTGKYQDAVDTLTQAVRIDPNNPNNHYLLGVAHSLTGNKSAATGEYKTLEKLNPELAGRLFGIINQ